MPTRIPTPMPTHTPPPSTPPRLLRLCYRAAIRLQPAAHRRRYGHQQLQLFDELWAHERPRSAPKRAAWAADLLVRAFWTAAAAHLHARRIADAGERRRSIPRVSARAIGADAVFTLRALRRAPWYAGTVILVIAVTLSLAVTVFAIVDGVLFRPLPYAQASRLVVVEPNFRGLRPYVALGRTLTNAASAVDIQNWQRAVPDAAITGFRAYSSRPLGNAPTGETGTAEIQSNFFDVVGMRPMLGGFSDATFADVAPDTLIRPVILVYDAWQRGFGGDPSALGRIVVTDPISRTGVRVVGVMPRGFSFPSTRISISVLTPWVDAPAARTDPTRRRLSVIARLPPKVSAPEFATQLMAGVTATASAYPVQGPRPEKFSIEGWRRQGPYDMVDVRPLGDDMMRPYGALFAATFAAVALLVLIAAANVSSLMTARAWERRNELTVRRALGASAADVGRLWLTESCLLLSMGAAIGLAGAYPLLQLIVPLLPSEVVLLKSPAIDWRVAGFVLITLVSLSLLVAAAPLRRSLRMTGVGTPNTWFTERARTPARFLVVSGQVAAAFVLTVVGALLVGSILSVYAQGLPRDASRIAAIEVGLSGGAAGANRMDGRLTRARLIRDRLLRVDGATDAAFVDGELLSGPAISPGFTPPPGRRLATAVVWGVAEGFFKTVALDIVHGRLPSDDELRTSAPVIVVSEELARAYWPDQSPIGQSLVHASSTLPYTVVGVVRDVHWSTWDTDTAMIYAPYTSIRVPAPLNIFLRTRGPASARLDEAVRAIAETDPLARPMRASALDDLFRDSVSLRRFQSWLFGGFAAAALAVVAVGILGLLAMSAARRTREIGIRCALGATPNGVARQLLREQLAAVLAGLVAGALVAAWASGFVKAYTYHVAFTDLRVWAAAIALTILTAGAGALLPAVRATRINPINALRSH